MSTALSKTPDFVELQRVVRSVYGLPNDRYFDLADMATNVGRFTMRAIKAVRKGKSSEHLDRCSRNLGIGVSWFCSAANRLHIDIDDALWSRFPYACPYCSSCPCVCEGGTPIVLDAASRPKSIADYQAMFAAIYPKAERSVAEAALHLVEEYGEYEEAILVFRTRHRANDLDQVLLEVADFLSCTFGLFTSTDASLAERLTTMFEDGCHECHQAPCRCGFDFVLNYNLEDRW